MADVTPLTRRTFESLHDTAIPGGGTVTADPAGCRTTDERQFKPANLRNVDTLTLRAKASPGHVAVMAFTSRSGFDPALVEFELPDDGWQLVEIDLDALIPERYDVTGIFVGRVRPGSFEMLIDDVGFERPIRCPNCRSAGSRATCDGNSTPTGWDSSRRPGSLAGVRRRAVGRVHRARSAAAMDRRPPHVMLQSCPNPAGPIGEH